MEALYHLGFGDVSGAKYAILPGDPGRVEQIAALLDNPRFLNQNREYNAWLGEIEKQTVLVMSTGMGGPSTAIAVEELTQCGIETFVRIGTCGGMAEKAMTTDLVIATGAIRQDGTSKEYVPVEFPAIADLAVTNALIQAAKKTTDDIKRERESGATQSAVALPKWHAGVVQSKDSYYGQHEPERMPIGNKLTEKYQAWIKAGCLASEMECSSLFIVAQTLGVRAGAILSVIWNQERFLKKLYNYKSMDTSLAIKTSVEAVRILIKNDIG